MITTTTRAILRRVLFPAGLLLAAAPAAFADVPGYEFMDFYHSPVATSSAQPPVATSSTDLLAATSRTPASAPSQPQFACTVLANTRVCIGNTR